MAASALWVMWDFSDHATFREKSSTTGLVGQAWGFHLSSTLCNKANFDPILLVKYNVPQKGLNMKKFYGMFSFLLCNLLDNTS